jgi:hypothetical protein
MGEIFNEPATGTTTIWEDNQSAIAYSYNAQVSEKTKHIDVMWHFLKDHVEQGTAMPRYLLTYQMVAHMLTKPMSGHAFTRHIGHIRHKEERAQCNASSPRSYI